MSQVQNNDFLKVLYKDNFDYVIVLDPRDESMLFVYSSPVLNALNQKIAPKHSLKEFAQNLIDTYVVDDEKNSVIDIMQMESIIDLLGKQSEIVRTLHINTPNGIQTEKLTICEFETGSNKEKMLLMTFSNIENIMNHDWMTDVYSRLGFLKEVEQILSIKTEKGKYAIVYTNIPDFKAANDILGTFNGDMMIFQTCTLLQKTFKPVVIARLEADHFAILTETHNLTEEAFSNMKQIPYVNASIHYHYQIHCGVYVISDFSEQVVHMLDYAQLVEKTVTAEHGKSYAMFDEQVRTQYLEQSMLTSELEPALLRGDFVPFFQPVVDVKTKKIISAEALVRWIHPKLGLIAPEKFVPAFESNGHISKIDHYMIQKVLEFNLKRKEAGLDFVPCAVNLSRLDFYDSNITNCILDLIDRYGDLPRFLKFEVTESAYTQLDSSALDFLSALQDRGVQILLDDYGSGMSSIASLEQFTFDILKIDMGFVRKIGKNKKAEAIIKSTIEMAHGLDALVVAEGVEDEMQFQFLADNGCDYIQGFYFYKPLSDKDFSALL